ncbi:mechanosensitive ion channel family protein [Gracilimonas halophila]|uniref:Mechanosensitive ion channel family protein n=1 Tax=Gracilimonas halophila TaxID=1834464 RepID=A0ABW5JL47_9BACT
MKIFKQIVLLLPILFLAEISLGSLLYAQNNILSDTLAVEEIPNDSLLLDKIDSLLNTRFSKFDSLASKLEHGNKARTDSLGLQIEGETEQAIAQLEKVISWEKVIMIILFFIATFYVTIFVSQVLDNFSERISRYRLRIKRMIPILRVVLWSFAIYIAIAGIIQPPYATVVTVMASIGIAVGLASQDILKNFFGGVMLILDRPFQVGDKIQFQEHYGEVLQIGLRSSRIVTPGDSVVTIPNGELIRTAVSNANTGALDCQVITEIYLPAECAVEEVKEIAYRAVISSRFVYLKKPISIITENEMHERRFILKLKVKAYVLDIRYEFPFQSDVTELILTELKNRGILKNEAITNQVTAIKSK